MTLKSRTQKKKIQGKQMPSLYNPTNAATEPPHHNNLIRTKEVKRLKADQGDLGAAVSYKNRSKHSRHCKKYVLAQNGLLGMKRKLKTEMHGKINSVKFVSLHLISCPKIPFVLLACINFNILPPPPKRTMAPNAQMQLHSS